MQRCLSEDDRNQLVERIAGSHRIVSAVYAELKKSYSSKLQVVKTAAKTERFLAQLRRELLKMDLESQPSKSLPVVKQGNTVIDPHNLGV